MSIPISFPAAFAPVTAVAYGSLGSDATCVDSAHPLPVTVKQAATASTALTGTASASGDAGPFAPELGRAIVLTTSGTWTGTVQLLRSTDGGTTKLPLTVGGISWAAFTANCNEPVWVEADADATFYLALTVVSGTIAYRVSQ